jgi:carbamoyl-phosphate synthase large subunit
MNILITSVGRQVYLLKAFKKAINGNGKVFASDIDPKALALSEADQSFISPKFTNSQYIPWIKELCQKLEIDVLISLNVDDIIILSEFAKKFSEMKCQLIAGDPEIIRKTNDKYALQNISKELGLPILETSILKKNSPIEKELPVVAKPRYGKGARGNVVLNTLDEFLKFQRSLVDFEEEYVIQEFLEGVEYGFDIINDFEGNYLSLLGRKKITQRNGESFQAIIINPAFWEKEARRLSEYIRHKGTVNFDVIFSKDRGYLIDVNYRFSGDYVFSHSAGANTPQIYVDCFLGNAINKDSYLPEYNVISERIENGAKRI